MHRASARAATTGAHPAPGGDRQQQPPPGRCASAARRDRGLTRRARVTLARRRSAARPRARAAAEVDPDLRREVELGDAALEQRSGALGDVPPAENVLVVAEDRAVTAARGVAVGLELV